MKAAALLTLLLSVHVAARADFSYTSTRKSSNPAMAMMAGGTANRSSKTYFKGQKTRTEEGDTTSVIDFEAQTLTTINNAAKTYSVSSFKDLAAAGPSGASVSVSAKETGEHKIVNGFEAKELVVTIQVDTPKGRGPAGRADVDIDLWISPDVPGKEELRAFYERNAARFPAMAGSNAGILTAMTEVQRRMASLDGVPVEEVIKVKPVAGTGGMQVPAMPPMTPAQSAQMEQARAKLEAMKAQGGAQGAMAEQTLARLAAMSGGRGGAAVSGSAGALIEMTIDSTGFSTDTIPDSVFEVPAGYRRAAK